VRVSAKAFCRRRHASARVAGSTAYIRLPQCFALALAVCSTHCTLDSTPALPKSSANAVSDDAQPDAAGRGPTSGTPRNSADAGGKRDASRINTGQEPPESAGSDEKDAGTDASAQEMTDTPSTPPDAGTSTQPTEPTEPTTPDTMTPPMMTVPAECTRDALRTNANAYLEAMMAGDPSPLRLHASVRYTENGQNQQLGAGVWRRGVEVDFSRHVLDETRCSSITQAVLSSLTGSVVFGVRLLYRDGELLEVEAHVVPETLARIDVDMIVPIGNDRFVEPVVEERRMSREQLEAYAERYFDAAVSGGEVPPSTPDCRRRQNGVPLGNGMCNVPPGTMRFEQRRYPVLDVEAGVITASVIYDGHLGLYLIKMAGDTVQSIEIVGGATSASSGW
jgi:hypothetical protein